MSYLPFARGPRLAAGLTAILVLVAACSSAALSQQDNRIPAPAAAGGSAVQGVDQSRSDSQGGGTFPEPAASAAAPAGQYDVSQANLLIIKTGALSLQVGAIDQALATASVKISALGGYVAGSDRKGDGDQLVATATYRIPALQWDPALVALRALGDKVLAEQTQTQDVTGDVLDLGARITNLRATEAALQAIILKATKISDVLAVQQQLTDVRGQIEQLSTQQKHLQGQAAYSTLTVSYSLKPVPAVVTSQQKFDPNAEVDRASASLVDVLQGLATAGIWFAIVWLPILVALAIIGVILVIVLRRVVPGRGGMDQGPGPMLPTTTEG
jgi:hypothetical protein